LDDKTPMETWLTLLRKGCPLRTRRLSLPSKRCPHRVPDVHVQGARPDGGCCTGSRLLASFSNRMKRTSPSWIERGSRSTSGRRTR
jgi:hypothetical protein